MKLNFALKTCITIILRAKTLRGFLRRESKLLQRRTMRSALDWWHTHAISLGAIISAKDSSSLVILTHVTYLREGTPLTPSTPSWGKKLPPTYLFWNNILLFMQEICRIGSYAFYLIYSIQYTVHCS